MRYIRGGLAALILIAMVIFSIQNLAAMQVSFLGWSLNVPKVVIIIGTYVLGMITGATIFNWMRRLFRSNRPATTE